ncbi:hypothetical protein AAFF_G00241900 [Aldrovandia affinis]|uniref:Uncharacterized protein n=1 Tax=Aldrovandia affinis TaxID=143900 RepID=A0AAD7WUW5_9TELE|nr:hypothetical protein AAFF_G00241900 [Aldrovandia affinis]
MIILCQHHAQTGVENWIARSEVGQPCLVWDEGRNMSSEAPLTIGSSHYGSSGSTHSGPTHSGSSCSGSSHSISTLFGSPHSGL